MRVCVMALILLLSPVATLTARLVDVAPVDVPRIDDIVIDGNTAEWRDRGFVARLITDQTGTVKAAPDFTPTMRLAWDRRGLIVVAEVVDDIPREHDYDRRLFMKDSVEFFVASAVGDLDHYMVVIAPGIDPAYPQPRSTFFDQRQEMPTAAPKSAALTMPMARRKTPTGYTIEALLPWENLGIVPLEGLRLGFQAYFMDNDGGETTYAATWYPAHDTHLARTRSMFPLRLASAASPESPLTVRGENHGVTVVGAAGLAGQRVTLRRNGAVVSEAVLAGLSERFAAATVVLPQPTNGSVPGVVEVLLGDKLAQRFERQGAAALVAQAMREGKLTFYQNVFGGQKFPKLEFQNPDAVRKLIGEVQITTRFYDAHFNPVEHASAAGRYGAVVEVKPQVGRATRRFFTLFRVADGEAVPSLAIPLWTAQGGLDVAIGGGKTLKSGAAAAAMDLAEDMAARRAWQLGRPGGAGSATAQKHEWVTADQAWWVAFKRGFYGVNAPVPKELGPTPCDPPGPVLREGTARAAGLREDVLSHVESICAEWLSANGGQGFVLCLARHGVVFYHRAHGNVAGKPMTVDLPCNIASLTKTFTGALVMSFVDRGLIGLDEPIERLVPAIRGLEKGVPVTLRQLTTHTSGLSGHWGDEVHDFEEQIADELPFIERPVHHLYSGAGFALAVKAMEMLTGEPLPVLYERHIFSPLGLRHTSTEKSHTQMRSTAMDIARLGQMLRNGGVYGPWRVMSPETVQRMKPTRLTMILGADTQKTWGVGLWGEEEARGYTSTAYGHGGATGAMLRVDEELDLVMSVSSAETRPYFTGEMRERLLRSIREHIVAPAER